MSVLEGSITEISNWRESSLNSSIDDTLEYGQGFVDLDTLKTYGFELVPQIEFEVKNFEHQTVLDALEKYISKTNVALTDTARGGTEGVILRNKDRSKIVKLRFEDYRRTLKSRK